MAQLIEQLNQLTNERDGVKVTVFVGRNKENTKDSASLLVSSGAKSEGGQAAQGSAAPKTFAPKKYAFSPKKIG